MNARFCERCSSAEQVTKPRDWYGPCSVLVGDLAVKPRHHHRGISGEAGWGSSVHANAGQSVHGQGVEAVWREGAMLAYCDTLPARSSSTTCTSIVPLTTLVAQRSWPTSVNVVETAVPSTVTLA